MEQTAKTKENIELIIENNRPELNAFGGASFGSKYFKTEARAAILNFEELKHNVESSGNIDFIVNRTPLRIKIKDYNIQSIALKNDATGAAQLVLNDGFEGEVRFPYLMADNKPVFSKVADEALHKALKGDNSVIFADAKKLCDQVNALNTAEIARLTKLIEDAKKWIQGINNAINENKRKADEYVKQVIREKEGANSDAVIIAPTGGTMQMSGVVAING